MTDTCQSVKEFVNVRHNGQQYEVELPFFINDNYSLCHNGLKSMHFKLSKTPHILREYGNIIQEQLEAGIIEHIPHQSSEELRGCLGKNRTLNFAWKIILPETLASERLYPDYN